MSVKLNITPPQARKIGILVDGFADLAGATDFIVGFVDGALRAADKREIVIIFRAPPKVYSPLGLAKSFQRFMRGSFGCAPNIESYLAKLRQAGLRMENIHTVERSAKALNNFCIDNSIEVIGPFTSAPPKTLCVPTIGYIYDFQHIYLEHLFSFRERKRRNKNFRKIMERSDVVVVNSMSVKHDADQQFPQSIEKVVALPFSAAASPDWFELNPALVKEKYGIGNRFFMISNQFWIHKKHEIAIQSFAKVVEREPKLELVLTGATDDFRVPDRLNDIEKLIDILGLTSKVHILGLIPKMEQVALLRSTEALIQPTAFEGGPGGGSVFDAVSVGTPAIVSDIPVNREIEQYVFSYFKLDDVESLTERMMQCLDASRVICDTQRLLDKGIQRREFLGKEIWRAANLALRNDVLAKMV